MSLPLWNVTLVGSLNVRCHFHCLKGVLLVLFFASFVTLPLGFLFVWFFLFGLIYVIYNVVNFHFVNLHIIRSHLRFLFRGVGRRLKICWLLICYWFVPNRVRHFRLIPLILNGPFSHSLSSLVYRVVTAPATLATLAIFWFPVSNFFIKGLICPLLATIIVITVCVAEIALVMLIRSVVLVAHILRPLLLCLCTVLLRLLILLLGLVVLPYRVLSCSLSWGCLSSFGSSISLSLLLLKSLLFQILSF